MESVIQHEKCCYVCGTTYNLQSHHCIYGTANRKQAEKYGLKVWLCQEHHTGNAGVHFNKDLDNHLKFTAQTYFEEFYGDRKKFIEVFGKSFL